MIILKIHAIEDFNKFKTELGILLEFISCASSGDKLEKAMEEKKVRWSALRDEEINLLNICMDANLTIAGEFEKGAENNVCKGIEEYAAKRKAEGKAEGEECLSKLINLLYIERRMDDILAVTSDAEKRAQLYKEYGIA